MTKQQQLEEEKKNKEKELKRLEEQLIQDLADSNMLLVKAIKEEDYNGISNLIRINRKMLGNIEGINNELFSMNNIIQIS